MNPKMRKVFLFSRLLYFVILEDSVRKNLVDKRDEKEYQGDHLCGSPFLSSASSSEFGIVVTTCRPRAVGHFIVNLRPGSKRTLTLQYRRNRMTRKRKGVTRRRFLEQVGLAGGS